MFWQAFRSCSCDGGYETGPVRSFVIRAAAPKLRVAVQGRAYAGYPIAIGLEAPGVPDGSVAVLEHAAGKDSKMLYSGKVSAAKAEAITTLPAGRARLRWRVTRSARGDIPARLSTSTDLHHGCNRRAIRTRSQVTSAAVPAAGGTEPVDLQPVARRKSTVGGYARPGPLPSLKLGHHRRFIRVDCIDAIDELSHGG